MDPVGDSSIKLNASLEVWFHQKLCSSPGGGSVVCVAFRWSIAPWRLLVWWFSVLYLACGARSWLNVRCWESDMVMMIDDDDDDDDDDGDDVDHDDDHDDDHEHDHDDDHEHDHDHEHYHGNDHEHYDGNDHDNLPETWRMMRETYSRGCERPCLKWLWHSWRWACLVKIARFEWKQCSTSNESNDLLLGIQTEYCNFQHV